MTPTLAAELRRLLDADAATVADDAWALDAHAGRQVVRAPMPPGAVVFARSAQDVSRLLRFCSARGVPVTARGAGYGYVGGCVPMPPAGWRSRSRG